MDKSKNNLNFHLFPQQKTAITIPPQINLQD